MMVPLAGGDPVALASGQRSPYDIAIDGDSIYWTTDGLSLSEAFVMKMPLAAAPRRRSRRWGG